jgi:hypothetical protein
MPKMKIIESNYRESKERNIKYRRCHKHLKTEVQNNNSNNSRHLLKLIR